MATYDPPLDQSEVLRVWNGLTSAERLERYYNRLAHRLSWRNKMMLIAIGGAFPGNCGYIVRRPAAVGLVDSSYSGFSSCRHFCLQLLFGLLTQGWYCSLYIGLMQRTW